MAKNDSRKSTPKSDERNIVGKEHVDIQDIEDRITLIWEKNKGIILGGLAVVIALFVGFQGFKIYQRQATVSLQRNYQEADSPDAKADWALDKSGQPLAGFALKELGDKAYAAGDAEKAARYYREAANSAVAPVDQAATIALAVALIDQGKNAEAKELLQPIAKNDQAAGQAEAQYRLAQVAKVEGDAETARTLIESISEEDLFWKSRARALANTLPEGDA